MASLRKRGSKYYIVFSRRRSGKLEQNVVALGTDSKRRASRLKFELEDASDRGDINPFCAQEVRKELESSRRRSRAGMSLDEVGERFLESRSHVADVTLRNYEYRLGRLERSIGSMMPVRLIRESDVQAFCFQPHLSRASRRTYLRYCKMLFGWMVAEGYLDESPAAGIRYPRRKVRISDKTLSEDQLRSVLGAHKEIQRRKIVDGRTRGLHVWFKPLVTFAFYTGLRRGEIVRMTWDKIDLMRGFIEVTDTKPGRERVVPIHRSLDPVLRAWHRLCGRPERGLVFAKTCVGERRIPLNANHVTQVFKKYVRAAGLPDDVNFHGLRHSCATYLLRQGMDLSAVSKMLGHAGPSTTMIYEHLNPRDLQRRMRELGL